MARLFDLVLYISDWIECLGDLAHYYIAIEEHKKSTRSEVTSPLASTTCDLVDVQRFEGLHHHQSQRKEYHVTLPYRVSTLFMGVPRSREAEPNFSVHGPCSYSMAQMSRLTDRPENDACSSSRQLTRANAGRAEKDKHPVQSPGTPPLNRIIGTLFSELLCAASSANSSRLLVNDYLSTCTLLHFLDVQMVL